MVLFRKKNKYQILIFFIILFCCNFYIKLNAKEENKNSNNKMVNNMNLEQMNNQNKYSIEINNASYSDRIKKISFSDSISGIFFNKKTNIVDLAIVFEDMGAIFEKVYLQELKDVNENNSSKEMISDYLFELMEMGYENISAADFREKLNENGIKFSINKTQDDLIIRIRCLKENLNEALDLVFKAFANPNFCSENLQIAKNLIISKIQNFYQNNTALANTYFLQNIFKDSIYEPNFPKLENFNLIELKDLQNYHSKILSTSKKIKIIMVGDIEINDENLKNQIYNNEKFKAFFEKVNLNNKESQIDGIFKNFTNFFKNFSKKDSNQEKNIELNFDHEKIVYIKEGEKNPQTIINFAHKGMKISDDNYIKLSLLMDILGGKGLESLLMKKLREEKGLTYGIYFSPVQLRYSSLLHGTMPTNSNNDKNAIIEEIKSVIQSFSQNGISENDLLNIKNKTINKINFYFKDNESILSSMIFLDKNSLSPDYFDKLSNLINNIDLNSINNFAKEFFDVNQIKFVVY